MSSPKKSTFKLVVLPARRRAGGQGTVTNGACAYSGPKSVGRDVQDRKRVAHSAGDAADGNGAAARTKGGAWAHGTRQWAPTARANGRTEGAQQQHGGIPGVALGSAHTTKEPVMVPDWLPAPAASSSSSRPPTGVMTPSEWLPSGYCKKEGTSLCGHTARSFDGARLARCGTCTCHRICPGHVLCSGPRAHPPLRAHTAQQPLLCDTAADRLLQNGVASCPSLHGTWRAGQSAPVHRARPAVARAPLALRYAAVIVELH